MKLFTPTQNFFSVLVSFIFFSQVHAQNISVSVSGNLVTLTMSGATTVSNLSTALTNSNNTLTITSTITGTLSLSGSPTGVTVNNTSKTTTVDLSTFTSFAGIELVGSTGDDAVTIGTGGIVLTNANGGTDQSIIINLGTGTDIITVSNPLTSKNYGNISLTASKNIVVSGAVSTAGGGITLSANQQVTPSSGNFVGIAITADITTTNNGDITVNGKGGNSGSSNVGVSVSGKMISALGTGSVSVTGRGGASTGSTNYGVNIFNANSKISANGGTVAVTGYGGGTSSTSGYNFGICLHNSGGTITNTGTGAGATVTVIGYGGPGTNDSEIGVDIQYLVSSSGGDIYVEGVGGASAGSFTSNIGVLTRVAGMISAGGNGNVTVVGTASATNSSSDGIQMQGTSKIQTNNGNIDITVTSHSNNWGLRYTGTNSITAGGNKNVTIRANKYNATTLSAGTGTVTIKPNSGISLDLGGSDGTSTLALSSSELNSITASHIILGDSTQSSNINVSASLSLSSVSTSVTLHTASTLSFASGTFSTGARTLNIFANTISRTSGVIDVSNASANLIFKNLSAVSLPSGLINGNTVQNLTVSGAGGLTLGDSTIVAGVLSLSGGDLALGSNCLVLNGTIGAMSSTNSITGGSNSKLRIGGSGTTSMGTLYFTSGSANLHTLALNRSGASGTNPVVNLGNDVTISGVLTLTTGKIALGSSTMTFTGTTITGGGAGSYVQINGSGGFKRAGGSSVLFPVGFNPYMPVTLGCASCGGTDFTIRVETGITDDANNPIPTNIVNSTWYITSSTNMTADLTFQWPSTQEVSMSHSNVTLANRTAAPGAWNSLGSGFSVAGSDPYTLSYSGFSFSSGVGQMFGIGGPGVALPVDLIDLQAGCEEVTWSTANERDHASFEILGSMNGVNWISVGNVQSSAQGASVTRYSYRLKTNAEKAYGFYRLNMYANNGSSEYSPIVQNTCVRPAIVTIYPNPANNHIYVDGSDNTIHVEIFNAFGDKVYDGAAGSAIDIKHLAPGIYSVRVGEGQYRFVKTQ